jgi:hypothetical protein
MSDADNDFPSMDKTFIAARPGGKAVMTFGLRLHLLRARWRDAGKALATIGRRRRPSMSDAG